MAYKQLSRTSDLNDQCLQNCRMYRRENVAIIAQYFLVGRSSKYLGCTIINLSRNGAGALFPLKEKLQIGDCILVDMVTPHTFEHISVLGEVKRCHKKGSAIFGGIQFEKPLSDDEFRVLSVILPTAYPPP